MRELPVTGCRSLVFYFIFFMTFSSFKSGERVDKTAALVKNATVQKTKTGKDFLALALTDGETEIQAKLWDWDTTRETPKTGAVCVFSGRVEEYQGAAQIILSAVASAPPGEDDPSRFLPHAPRPANEMLEDVRRAIAGIKDNEIRRIVEALVNDALAHGFAAAPASQKLHHAEIGGLLHHITDMLRAARALAEIHTVLDSDLLIAGVIVHDLGKLRELSLTPSGLADDYTAEGRLLGSARPLEPSV